MPADAAARRALPARRLLLGAFLVVEDALEPADAIVVLAGGTPFREVPSAALLHRGLAPRVMVSRHALSDREQAPVTASV